MDVEAFLNDLRNSPDYAGQITYVREVAPRPAVWAEPLQPLPPPVRAALESWGIDRLYEHQARAVDQLRDRKNVVVVSSTAGGKSLCFQIPIVEMLASDPDATALLLFPTKALCQDQFRSFQAAAAAAGVGGHLAGVFDGDTPGAMRRKLCEQGSVIFSNPDMLHAALMAQHGRWARFLAKLRLLVLDELHVYSGIFGSNMANLLRRFDRVCRHYGGQVQIVACSATIGNPLELARELTGREFSLIDGDGSARGRRVYVFWNPPRIAERKWRSRRSANVEAHGLMAELVRRGVGTITFSKAKMTAEMIYRYVCDKLRKTAPELAEKISPYRGGYQAAERREIERRLFSGELLGVSTTRALELGIDVGALAACIIVGYPGTLASFLQQSGRAGRGSDDALVILIGLDTAVNQYVMSHPEYLFARGVEQAVIEPDNPFVITGHLRCAAHELPISADEASCFGPHAELVLKVLQDNLKVKEIDGAWYHAAAETPQHEMSLRDCAGANVVIEDADTGQVVGEVNRFDAPPILHPGAVYMHRGDTYLVETLDLDRNIATVKRVEVDYYTDPLGGTDVHHIDHALREKPFGTATAYWGEVTAYFKTGAYERIHFYSLDAISLHDVRLPTLVLETTALWLVPPEELMAEVLRAGLDHSGLMGIGYATRMLLPLFMTCDTLDFSHSIGSVNSPWNAIFIYERYPLGLGFTEKAYCRLHEIMPAVLDNIKKCTCDDGCPCCVGKPLRQYASWQYDRGEAFIPSKRSAVMILEGMLAGGEDLCAADVESLTDRPGADKLRLEQALRRRLERKREPQVFHPIEPKVPTGYPEGERREDLGTPDVAERHGRRRSFASDLRKRLAKRIQTGRLDPHIGKKSPPQKVVRSNNPPGAFAPSGESPREEAADIIDPAAGAEHRKPIDLGDPLAARARKMLKSARKGGEGA